MYKLLAMDLDGTLLNDLSELPENNIKAIEKATSKGVRVCLCSGRSYLSLRHYEKQLGLSGEPNYGISFNGALVYKTWNHEMLRDVRLDNALAMLLIDELAKFESDAVIYIKDRLFAEKETENIKAYANKSLITPSFIDSFYDIKEDVSKVLVRGNEQELNKIAKHMLPLTQGRCNQFLTDKTLLEFTNLEATKGSALMFLADHLGIERSQVIAVGDNYNDIHMIEAAGLGIAVANAVSDAKEAADYTTKADNNAGALAEIVEMFIDGIFEYTETEEIEH